MIKNRTHLETVVNNNAYRFECEINAGLGDALEAIGQFRAYILGRISEHEEQQKALAKSPEESVK